MARILVVDDELHVLRLVQVNLERAGHTVLTLDDPREALETIRRERPDLVVLDVMMPWVTGIEIQQSMAAEESLRRLPVVLLPAKCADADVWRKRNSGLNSTGCPQVAKPFDPRELAALIDRLLAASSDG